MTYLNWYEYMKNPYKDQSKNVLFKKDDSKVWTDLITENKFLIRNADYNVIINFVSKYIAQLLEDERLEDLFLYLRGEEDIKDKFDINLFPKLPYQTSENEEEKVARISDYLSLRTGILFVISKEEDRNKCDIRIVSYLSGIAKYLNNEAKQKIKFLLSDIKYDKYKKLLEDIDYLLINKEKNQKGDFKFKKYKLDIVKGGVVKVKEYFLETNKIKEIRGSSIILDRINRKIIPEYIDKKLIKECIIYAGGGNILIIAPENKGTDIAKKIEEIYEETTVIAQNVSVSDTVKFEDISDKKYFNTMSSIQSSLNERQMSKIDFRTKNFKGSLKYMNLCKKEPDYLNDYEDKYKECNDNERLCQSCNIRIGNFEFYNNKNKKSYICRSCLYKNIVGGKIAKNSFKQYYQEYAKKQGYEVIDSKVNGLDDLKSRNNSIGVIYGDGNNMGAVIKNVKTLLQMKYFSDKTENSIYEAVYGAFLNNIKINGKPANKFEIIALGGDDIFIIVPGQDAILVSKDICDRFGAVFKNYTNESNNNLTMSLGITIAKYNKPVQYLFDMSMQLLKQAKKKAKKVHQGTVDFLILETDAGFASNVDFIRMGLNKDNKIRTLRPFSNNELDSMIKIVNKLKNAENKDNESFRSTAYNFMNASFSMSVNEANLYYQYQNNKNKKNEILDSIYYEFSNAYGDIETKKNLFISRKNENENLSIWTDIVEMWDYVKEGETNE